MDEPGDHSASLEPPLHVPGGTTIWNNQWRQIYDQLGQAIIAYARRRGLSEQSAEDVLQEVMATLIRAQHGQVAGYDSTKRTFQAWLWTVIRYRVLSVRRKDAKEPSLSTLAGLTGENGEAASPMADIPAPLADPDETEEEEWRRALLTAAIRKVQERVKPENFAIYMDLLEQKATPEELAKRKLAGQPIEPAKWEEQLKAARNAIDQVKHRCEEMVRCEARVIRATWEQLNQTPVA